MRKVELKSWSEQVRKEESDQLHPAYRKYFYYGRRRYFNKLSLLGALTLASFLVGTQQRVGNVLGVSLVVFAGYLYLRARATAEALRLSRSAPAKAVERDEIEVRYEIENRGGFAIFDVLFIDEFAGSTDAKEVVWIDEAIGANTSFKASYRRRCDAGMGVFAFGPLKAVVTDPLGVFEFTVTEDCEGAVGARSTESRHAIEVYPKLEHIPELPLHGSKESFLYGVYDLPTRGASVNFSGIRDFTRGDPLKHIAWRISARNQRLLVKEFEKIANTEITVLLNMDARDHMGRKSDSTWEYSKDAALAIVTQQLTKGNSIQLLSDKAYVEPGRGEAHANLIARVIFGLMPISQPRLPGEPVKTLVDRYLDFIPAGSAAIWVGPLFGNDPEALLWSLQRLQLKEVDVFCVLVHPTGFAEGKVHGENRFLVESGGWKGEAALERLVFRLGSQGIPAFVLRSGRSIGRSILEGMARQ